METTITDNSEVSTTSTPFNVVGFAGSAGNIDNQDVTLSQEKPSASNTRALITIPVDNRFLIDWIAFTFKIKDPHEVVKIIALKSSLFTELDSGRFGYRKSLRFDQIGIYFDGQECMGCHVVMSGQGCRQYEGQFEDSPWNDLFTRAVSNNAKITRLDLAYDNVDGDLDLVKLKDAIINRQIRSRFKNASENINFILGQNIEQQDDGHTIYFGKRSSRVYMRFYDKAAQMKTPLPWIRAEIELKDKPAQKAINLLVSGLPVGQLFVGVINNYVAVINQDDSNISRCTIQPWWSSWLQSTEKIRLSTSKVVKTVEESMEYLKKQYSPTIATIREHLGVVPFSDFIREIIKDGIERMTMKHEDMLFLSAQKKADNYDQEREDFEERAAIMQFEGGMDRTEAEEAARLLLDQDELS